MPGLDQTPYLKFPFTITDQGPKTSSRGEHVREQIEQVLFTNPKERVFRPEFGVGVKRLVFEPNNTVLRNTVLRQINVSLAEALYGEVDPRTLEVDVKSEDAGLTIFISYVLAAVNQSESHIFEVNTQGGSNG